MAYGVPVVGTAIPGIASLVDDGVDGLLVPPGDVPALAAAIERIGTDPGAPHPAGGRRPGPDAGLLVGALHTAALRAVPGAGTAPAPREARSLMRIMFATGSLDIGGSERQTVRLAHELRRRGRDRSRC